MDCLCNPHDYDLGLFYKNTLIPLSYYGFGSIESLLKLKRSHLQNLKLCMNDPETKKLYFQIHHPLATSK